MKKEIKIGLFALLMLACLYWGFNFLKGKDIFNRSHIYYASYEQVNGIQPSAPVIIKGVKVGMVSKIDYNPAESDLVVLTLNVRSKYEVPDNSVAKVFTNGFVGGKAVEITLGNSPTLLRSGEQIRTTMDKDFLEVAGSELEYFRQKLGTVVNELTLTLAQVNTLLAENGESFHRTLDNLASVTASLDRAIEPAEISGIVSDIHALTGTLKDNSDNFDRIIGNVEQLTDSLRQAQVATLVNNMSSTLGQVNTALDKINAGDGTLGLLLNDGALYDSLTTATSNLSLLLEDLKAHPKRYVHFSLFGGGRKNRE